MSKAPTARDIHVDLWPAGAWTADDVVKFKALLGDLGRVAGRRSSTARGEGLQTTLYFAAVAAGSGVLAGFLARLGEDIYESFRAKLKRLLKVARYRRRQPKRLPNREADSLTIIIEGRSPNAPTLSYMCEFYEEQDLDTFFSSLAAVHWLLSNPDLNELPRATGIREIRAQLCTEEGRQQFA